MKPTGVNLLGGRGKCHYCGGVFTNVAYHEAHQCIMSPSYAKKVEDVKKEQLRAFYMDDVGTVALEATELIQGKLREYGIELKDGEEDDFYNPIFAKLEKLSNGEYKSYN